MTSRLLKVRFLLLSFLVLVVDQWSKWWVESTLPLHSVQPVIPGLFNLTHLRNTGIAFGLFAMPLGEAPVVRLTLLGLLALGVVATFFWRAAPGDRLLLASLALILGGAVGNLFDRIATGAVTDFVDLYVGSLHWPAFNVADSAISVGIVLMVFDAVRPGRPPAAREQPAA